MAKGKISNRKKVIQIIKENKTFLITAHVNLEGDALGSELAMYGILRQLGKSAIVLNNDPTPNIYSFLPYTRQIHNFYPKGKNGYDVALVLDCSDSSRTGNVKEFLGNARYIVNIDHHISNTQFGDVNWVDPLASSACEMVFRLSQDLKVINRNIALCIYTGIFTDTGNFTYANTTRKVHNIIAELMKYGIKPAKIAEQLHSCCSQKEIKFIGQILSSVKLDVKNKICWVCITDWPLLMYDLTEIIFSILKLVKGVEVFVLFKQIEKRKIRVNFRSRAYIDVNRIAKFFGGGGHKRASGTTIEGSLSGVEKQVIRFIKRYTNGKKNK